MAEKKKMSVEEILAAARKKDSGAGGGSASAPSPAEPPPAAAAAPATQPSAPTAPSGGTGASKPAAKAKPGSMSVAEMLAAARAQKSAPAAAATAAPVAKAEPKPAAPKPAAKPAAEKAAPKPTAAKTPAIDTTSILAAARSAAKPGPVSKAEAAAKGLAPAETSGKKRLEVPPMPAKPSFAKPPAAAKAEPTRRGFFDYLTSVVLGSSLAFGFASLAVTQLMWVLGLARYMFPNILTEPPSRFKVGFPDVLGSGQVDERFKAQFGVWIVKAEYEGQLQVFALKTVCTHLGCTPNWLEGEQKFKCPCHGSGFYKDGVNFEGPAPRPLERYAIKIADDGQLEVDKSRVFHEELGQWKDSGSFVPA